MISSYHESFATSNNLQNFSKMLSSLLLKKFVAFSPTLTKTSNFIDAHKKNLFEYKESILDASEETDQQLLKGIAILVSKDSAFDFLKDDEDLYENIKLRNKY